ncbi:glycosyltransferase family 1 protein [Candidatus Roizmanbacteria bacterium]|nr:glycosyltransferase family 1 protein [Candidatus Roizmanbacteria bacterium]
MEKLATWPNKVLMTTELPTGRADGVSNLITHLGPQFVNAGIEVILVQPHPKKGFSLPGYADAKVAFGFPAYYHQFNEQRVDVVHALAPALLGMWALDWAAEHNTPRVASFNTNIPEYMLYYRLSYLRGIAWFLYRCVHNSANLNLAPSQSVAEQMTAHGIKHVEVWGRGVDSKLFNPDKRSEKWRAKLTNGRPTSPVVLYVGRLAGEKNLEILEPTIATLPEAQFVFVGGGPRRKDLEKIFAFPNVTFTGYLFGEELASTYASADIFIFPSLTEGFPNSVLEALSSGLCVVGFDAPGVREIIGDSGAGLLARPNDIESLKDNLFRLISDSSLRSFLGTKGREYALTRTWQNCFARLLDYYRSLRLQPK